MNNNGYKIVMIGDSGVGKSSLVFWILHNKAIPDTWPTIGAAFNIKEITVNSKKIKFNIWDTAGQERFRSIAKMYYKNTIGCMCVFDITNRVSFNNLKYWISDYHENNNNPYCALIIVANKCDHDKSQWQVTEPELKEFANENNCNYIYTSCITGENTPQSFQKLAESIMNLKINLSDVDPIQNNSNLLVLQHNLWPMRLPTCKC